MKGLKGFPKENYKIERRKKYTDEELLRYPIQFYEKYGRPPTKEDFKSNPEYPNCQTCVNRFGSWINFLKLTGFDVDTMVKNGVIENEYQKGRFGEIIIRDHFKRHPIELAGENHNSPCDGICPSGKSYDVKSSKLGHERKYWDFHTNNKYKEEIEIYYLLGFNEDWTKLEYAWRIPGEIVEKDHFSIWLNSWSRSKFTVKNMKEYDITDKIRDVLRKYGFFNKVKNGAKS